MPPVRKGRRPFFFTAKTPPSRPRRPGRRLHPLRTPLRHADDGPAPSPQQTWGVCDRSLCPGTSLVELPPDLACDGFVSGIAGTRYRPNLGNTRGRRLFRKDHARLPPYRGFRVASDRRKMWRGAPDTRQRPSSISTPDRSLCEPPFKKTETSRQGHERRQERECPR